MCTCALANLYVSQLAVYACFSFITPHVTQQKFCFCIGKGSPKYLTFSWFFKTILIFYLANISDVFLALKKNNSAILIGK